MNLECRDWNAAYRSENTENTLTKQFSAISALLELPKMLKWDEGDEVSFSDETSCNSNNSCSCSNLAKQVIQQFPYN